MNLLDQAEEIKNLTTSAKAILVLLPQTTGRDGIAAGLALYLSLKQLGKTITIACPKQPTVSLSHLVGIDKLTQELSNRNFIISLDYAEGAIEKVSYNIEGNKFNLVIEPSRGAPQFNKDNVEYKYSGVITDLIITLGAENLSALDKYYLDNKEVFEQKPIVAISTNQGTAFGKVNIYQQASSLSELMAQLLKTVELPINADIASNLYDGIISGSRNFTNKDVSAITFDTCAWLLRNGAKRRETSQLSASQAQIQPQTPPQPQPAKVADELPVKSADTSTADETGTPLDWYKPKIYKGSGLL